jgi:hypothetical protein
VNRPICIRKDSHVYFGVGVELEKFITLRKIIAAIIVTNFSDSYSRPYILRFD